MQIWRAARPTWPLRSLKGNPAEPKQMCGAAAVRYCTCSTGVSRGQDTTPVDSTWRYALQRRTRRRTPVWFLAEMFSPLITVCRLQIANEPPPLREIPHDCSPFTAEVLKAGLQKDPSKRASASNLKEKTDRALREGKELIHLWWKEGHNDVK